MAGWEGWVALLGGILAVIGAFVSQTYYLSLIGGVLAIIGAIALMMK
jgi:hypothetical protein